MTTILIKAPDGRVVSAPRLSTVTREVDGVFVTSIDPAKLKPGWCDAKPSPVVEEPAPPVAVVTPPPVVEEPAPVPVVEVPVPTFSHRTRRGA